MLWQGNWLGIAELAATLAIDDDELAATMAIEDNESTALRSDEENENENGNEVVFAATMAFDGRMKT